jgi:hypothetical protein
MKKEKDKNKRKSVIEDEEIKKLLKASEEQIPEQLETFQEIGKEEIIPPLPDTQDPDLAYKLYYGFIQKFLRKYLPKGEEFKEARRVIRKEKSIFLKEGKEKGRDERQAYTHLMKEASDAIIEWYNVTKGKDLFGLYTKFKNLNAKRDHLLKKQKSD